MKHIYKIMLLTALSAANQAEGMSYLGDMLGLVKPAAAFLGMLAGSAWITYERRNLNFASIAGLAAWKNFQTKASIPCLSDCVCKQQKCPQAELRPLTSVARSSDLAAETAKAVPTAAMASEVSSKATTHLAPAAEEGSKTDAEEAPQPHGSTTNALRTLTQDDDVQPAPAASTAPANLLVAKASKKLQSETIPARTCPRDVAQKAYYNLPNAMLPRTARHHAATFTSVTTGIALTALATYGFVRDNPTALLTGFIGASTFTMSHFNMLDLNIYYRSPVTSLARATLRSAAAVATVSGLAYGAQLLLK